MCVLGWASFTVPTIVHVWANYKGLRVLRLRILNQERGKGSFGEFRAVRGGDGIMAVSGRWWWCGAEEGGCGASVSGGM